MPLDDSAMKDGFVCVNVCVGFFGRYLFVCTQTGLKTEVPQV